MTGVYVTGSVDFCFFKQKTAYEIRPRDWSSDVCSSDLQHACDLCSRLWNFWKKHEAEPAGHRIKRVCLKRKRRRVARTEGHIRQSQRRGFASRHVEHPFGEIDPNHTPV